MSELHRLHGVFVAALRDTQIQASSQEGIGITKEQKSISLEKRAEASYAEYRRQRASASEGASWSVWNLPLLDGEVLNLFYAAIVYVGGQPEADVLLRGTLPNSCSFRR